jgi:hypothetical protein
MTPKGGFQRVRRDVGCLWPALGVAVGLVAIAGWLGLGAATRGAGVVQQVVTPAVVRIPRPSSTATPLPTSVPIPTETALPVEPTGPISVGDLIEVYGTSGDGVRLRSAPTLEGTVLGLGMDSDVFQVGEGPVEAGGHTWWYLVNPYDTDRQGWAVGEYLRPLQGP